MNNTFESYFRSDFDLVTTAPQLAYAVVKEIDALYSELNAYYSAGDTTAGLANAVHHVWGLIKLYKGRSLEVSSVYRLLCDYYMIALQYAIEFGDESMADHRKRLWVQMMQVVIPAIDTKLREKIVGDYATWYYDVLQIGVFWRTRKPLLDQWEQEV